MDISFIFIFLVLIPSPGNQHPKRGGSRQFSAGTIADAG
jgi:hypothetical protein